MSERKLWRILPASVATGLLLWITTAAWGQQQYPYGYYQWPQRTTAQPAQPAQTAQPEPAQPETPQAESAPDSAAAAPVSPPGDAEASMPASQSAAAGRRPAGIQVVQSRLGKVLADAQGRTLYIFERETSGVPLCEGECARLWPPLLSDGSSPMATPFFVVPREDGSRQWAWNGRPLYRWIGDAEAGDVTGDGMNGVWHAVRVR